MSADIVIVHAYLDTLARDARRVAEMLEDASDAMNPTFPGNPRVTDAYDDFLGAWDQHRARLRDGVLAAAEALAGVSAAFGQVEDELIAALAG